MARKCLSDDDFPNKVIELTLREYNSIQVEHILRHKWYLSEEAGREININEVMKDWLESGLAQQFRNRFRVVKKPT